MLGELEPAPAEVVDWSSRYWNQFCESWHLKAGARTKRGSARWEPPSPGLLKINVDVGQGKDGHFWSVAAVGRDGRGVYVGSRTALIRRPINSLAAQLHAI